MSVQPLSEADFDKIEEILKRFGDKRAMNLEQIDGFLAAVVCSPRNIAKSEYFPVIWGDSIVNEAAFETKPFLKEFISLVVRHHDYINYLLREGEVFTPLMFEDENGNAKGNDWAKGFLRGTEFCRSEWAAYFGDEETGGALIPMFALAYENDPDPKMRPYKEPITDELRKDLIAHAAAGVMICFDYFESQRVMSRISIEDSTYRRITPKVGRNEPCPCGSGKKFKQCCGKVTLH